MRKELGRKEVAMVEWLHWGTSTVDLRAAMHLATRDRPRATGKPRELGVAGRLLNARLGRLGTLVSKRIGEPPERGYGDAVSTSASFMYGLMRWVRSRREMLLFSLPVNTKTEK